MTDIPLPWNGGGFVLLLILAVLVLVAALSHPLPWRCRHCGGRYPTEGDLIAHLTDVDAARRRHPAYLPEENAR